MQKYLFLNSMLFISCMLSAQQKALTEKGENVILYDDGTWKSLDKKESWTTVLDTLVCKKSSSSTFLVKGDKVNYGIWIDPKKWSFKKNQDLDSPAEYNFTLLSEDAYLMIIPEKIEVPLHQLKDLAFKNAQSAAPDAKIIREDIRKVNGTPVGCLQFEATIQGIKFSYLCYYYSGKSGSIQVMAYTSTNLFPKYKEDIESLLNGFVILNK